MGYRGIWNPYAAMRLGNVMRDERLAFSEKPEDCALHQAFGMSLWDWLALPENRQLRKNFDISMSTHASLYPSDAIAKGE